jgi:hypothetical protein
MTTRIIINNFEKAPELCDSWGWYVDLDYENRCNKYKPKKKYKYIIEINNDSKNENENDDEYEYYMNQYKNHKTNNHKTNKNFKSSIPVFLEPIEEEKQEKQEKKHYLVKLVSATIITGLLTYIIFFTI